MNLISPSLPQSYRCWWVGFHPDWSKSLLDINFTPQSHRHRWVGCHPHCSKALLWIQYHPHSPKSPASVSWITSEASVPPPNSKSSCKKSLLHSQRLKSEYLGLAHWKSSFPRSKCLKSLHFVIVSDCLCSLGQEYEATVPIFFLIFFKKILSMCTWGTKTINPQLLVQGEKIQLPEQWMS